MYSIMKYEKEMWLLNSAPKYIAQLLFCKPKK